MKGKFIISYGNETMEADEKGFISRPSIKMKASGNWQLVGAVEYTNFGSLRRTYTLKDIKDGCVPWKYKNGNQRCFARDIDHGSLRVWMSPEHSIYYTEVA